MGGRTKYICSLCKLAGGWVWLASHNTFCQIHRESICTLVDTLYFFEAKCKIGMKSPGKFNWLSFISHQPHFCAHIHSLIRIYTKKIVMWAYHYASKYKQTIFLSLDESSLPVTTSRPSCLIRYDGLYVVTGEETIMT